MVAFYGGRDYAQSEWNSAFDAKVQAGSTFKAYALAAALQDGKPLTDRYYGNSPMYVNGASIPNSGGSSYGSVNLVQATQYSVNTAFVDLGQQIGLDKIAAAAEAAGIPAAQLAQHRKAATFPLGVASVSAVQQAGAYATFASGGVHHDPHVIRSVTDATGKTRKTDTTGRRVFTEDTAADATFAMEQVVTAGTGTGARLYDRPVAGKTGTTDASAAVWFNGYAPQLSVAVDMFRDDNLAGDDPRLRRALRRHPSGPDLEGVHDGRHAGQTGQGVPRPGDVLPLGQRLLPPHRRRALLRARRAQPRPDPDLAGRRLELPAPR